MPTTIPVTVSRKAAVFHGLCSGLLLALMMSPRPAVAEPAASPVITVSHAPDVAPAGAATQTGADAVSAADHRSASDVGQEPIDPQREALFRDFVQWYAMHAIDRGGAGR